MVKYIYHISIMLISITFSLFIIYSSHKLFIIKSQRKKHVFI